MKSYTGGIVFLSYSQEKHLLDRKGSNMNIQIFGTKKSFDTKKAQRYFKERRVKFQFVDLKEKGLSKGELESVARAAGGIDALIDLSAKDADTGRARAVSRRRPEIRQSAREPANTARTHRAQRPPSHGRLSTRRVEGLGIAPSRIDARKTVFQ